MPKKRLMFPTSSLTVTSLEDEEVDRIRTVPSSAAVGVTMLSSVSEAAAPSVSRLRELRLRSVNVMVLDAIVSMPTDSLSSALAVIVPLAVTVVPEMEPANVAACELSMVKPSVSVPFLAVRNFNAPDCSLAVLR